MSESTTLQRHDVEVNGFKTTMSLNERDAEFYGVGASGSQDPDAAPTGNPAPAQPVQPAQPDGQPAEKPAPEPDAGDDEDEDAEPKARTPRNKARGATGK